MAIKTRWIEFIHKLATGSKESRNLFTPLGAIFYSLVIFLFVIVALRFDKLFGISGLVPGKVPLFLAPFFFSAAFVLIGWSVLFFSRAKGTPVPFNPPPRLVTGGPYAYTRNPMLAGVFALLFGIGAMLGSASLLFIFTPLFILVNVWELKFIEEPELVKRLGQEYIEYRNSTPMFFPSLGKIFKRRR